MCLSKTFQHLSNLLRKTKVNEEKAIAKSFNGIETFLT